jgi:hypothetical protein
LGLVPAGGNYNQVESRVKKLALSTDHFTGKGWSKGWQFNPRISPMTLQSMLMSGGTTQSFKLENKLFAAGLKSPICEICGWRQVAADGRIPVELNHVNGVHNDNRIENLRILCPNYHSLQYTHRGKNKRARLARVL